MLPHIVILQLFVFRVSS